MPNDVDSSMFIRKLLENSKVTSAVAWRKVHAGAPCSENRKTSLRKLLSTAWKCPQLRQDP